MMPLSLAPVNIKLEVIGFRGGFGMRRRLADLGINVGMVVSVVSAQPYGPLVVDMKGSRFAIGRGIAHHVSVKPI